MGKIEGEAKTVETMRKHCFMEISIDSKLVGRIVIELYSDLVPKAAENFRGLCTGEYGKSKISGVNLHFKNTKFHKIVKGFMIQGGDILNRGGKGGESIYGPTFEDEKSDLRHDQPFLVTMANKGPNTNSSQFFITTAPAPHLDENNVIVGLVVEGTEYLSKIEDIAVDGRYRPVLPIFVERCGELSRVKVKKDRHNSSKATSVKDEPHKTKISEEEYLDPGVLPPPEVIDTKPNWLDRTAPYIPYGKINQRVKRKLIPWDIGYVSPTKSNREKDAPKLSKSSSYRVKKSRKNSSPRHDKSHGRKSKSRN